MKSDFYFSLETESISGPPPGALGPGAITADAHLANIFLPPPKGQPAASIIIGFAPRGVRIVAVSSANRMAIEAMTHARACFMSVL